ncbi:hypothetical protein HZC08_00380 [Candidatus Micrarchaeota archaeon]|nr:hypothetical protein [Candidatus Micrarchaeota archaeon]
MRLNCDYEIFHYYESLLSFVYGEDELKVKKTGVTEGNGLRILKEGRIGFSYFQEDLRKAFEAATQSSRFSPRSKFTFAPRRKIPKVKTSSEKTREMDPNRCREFVNQMVEGMGKIDSKRVSTPHSALIVKRLMGKDRDLHITPESNLVNPLTNLEKRLLIWQERWIKVRRFGPGNIQ